MPFIPILINPAADNTSDKPMKGHFLPRKSKLVFLNNSIEPVTAGLECQTPARRQKFPPAIFPKDPEFAKRFRLPQTRKSNHSNTERYRPLLPAQFPIEYGSGNKHRREHVGEQADHQCHRKPFDWTGSEQEQETAGNNSSYVRVDDREEGLAKSGFD